MRSATGGREVIGAATSIGAAAATTSTSPRLGIDLRIRSPAAATDGSRGLTIARRLPEIEVNGISAAAAATKC
jgi:hypothetical protein